MPTKVMAELQAGTPHQGITIDNIDVVDLAVKFEQVGAKAIIVSTSLPYFGRPSWIKDIRPHVTVPIIRRDFIYKEEHIQETKELGADAAVIIAELTTQDELDNLVFWCGKYELKSIVEAQSLLGLSRLIKSGTGTVYINNYNLRTGKIDLEIAKTLCSVIPDKYELIVNSCIEDDEEMTKYIAPWNIVDYVAY